MCLRALEPSILTQRTAPDVQTYLVLPEAVEYFCSMHSLAMHPSMRNRDAGRAEPTLRTYLELGVDGRKGPEN